MLSHIKQILRSNPFYQRYAQTWVNDCRYWIRNRRLWSSDYSASGAIHPTGHTLYFILDPRQRHPGFADRLKVFCCLGYIAKANGLDFRLILDEAFPLERYLQPASDQYDWRASSAELSHCRSEVKLLAYNGGRNKLPHLKPDVAQYHVLNYIGLDIIRRTQGEHWREVWRKSYQSLFRPTAYLEELLSRYQPAHPYTAVHIRFVNALDKLEDGFYNALDAEGQQRLIDKCLASLADIASNEPQPLLIFSDSERFLKIAQEHGYERVEGGTVGHVSFCHDALEKTILDFFLISRAQRCIRIDCPELYGSTFPLYASFVGGNRLWIYEADYHRLSLMPY